jgi:hypothetical protein
MQRSLNNNNNNNNNNNSNKIYKFCDLISRMKRVWLSIRLLQKRSSIFFELQKILDISVEEIIL